jgi:circadian clock protein KaiB
MAAKKATMRLQLFVTNGAPNSVLAVANLAAICKRHLRFIFKVEIIDTFKFPQRALAAGVQVTPHLAKLSPRPSAKIVGNLSDTVAVLLALGL